MSRRPPISTLFPTRRSSDLRELGLRARGLLDGVDHRQAAQASASSRGLAPGREAGDVAQAQGAVHADRKSTRLNSSHVESSYAVFCLKKKKVTHITNYFILF